MDSSALGAFRNVFPVGDLFRGKGLVAFCWAAAANVVFVALLLTGLLLIGLLHNEGRVYLPSADHDAYNALWNSVPPRSPDNTDGDEPADAEAKPAETQPAALPSQQDDQGLRAVAWDLRSRWWGPAVIELTRSWSGFESTGMSLLFLVVTGLVLGFVHAVLMAQVTRTSGVIANKIVHQLRESLHRQALRMGTSDMLNSQHEQVRKLFTTDAESVRNGVVQWIQQVSLQSGRLVALLIVLLGIDWRLTFECAVPVGVCLMIVNQMRRGLLNAQRLGIDRAEAELGLVFEGLQSSRLIHGYQIDEFERQRFLKHLGRYDGQLSQVALRANQYSWAARTLAAGCSAFVIALVAFRLLAPASSPDHLSLAESAIIIGSLFFAWRAVNRMVATHDGAVAANTAADHIYRFLNTIPEVSQAVGAKFIQPIQRFLHFDDITYRIGQRVVLNKLNLKVPATGSTAIVAFDPFEVRILTSLLPRFIEPASGRILFDEQDIAWATLESLRTETLLVDEDIAQITGTVLENISLGNPKYSLTQITEAAKQVHAHNFIQKLPQGYETVIGQHGETLDAGQRFRLALARAILRDPALLIIREPTGEISEDDKSLIDDACRRLMRDRCTVLLPSRLPTLKSADRIVLLNKGRVEVIGTHEVLVQNSAIYRHWEYLHFNEFRHEVSAAGS